MRLGDDLLAKSISAAFDRLPEPDVARLEGLERRLLLGVPPRPARKVRARFWWLFAGLIATGAAAWWGGKYWTDGQSGAKPPEFAPAAMETNEDEAEGGRTENNDAGASNEVAPNAETSSRTIYRREVY